MNVSARIPLLLVCFFLCAFSGCGIPSWFEKKSDTQTVSKRKLLEAGAELLINKNGIIPLKSLTPKPVFRQNYAAFSETVSLYTSFATRLDTFSTEIILLRDTDTNAVSALREKSAAKICVFFGNKYNLRIFLRKNPLPDALLYLPEFSDESLRVAAQMIFGGLPVVGHSAEFLPEIPSEKQYFFTSKTRLSYTDASELDFAPEFIAEIDSLVLHAVREGATPSAQILIAHKGNVFFSRSYGRHTYDSTAKITENSDLYDLASVTKILSALPVLMQLHGEGKFFLEAKLEDYLPEMRKTEIGSIKMSDLLTHRSGLPASAGFWVQDLLVKKRNNAYVSSKKSAKHPNEIFDNTFLCDNYYRDRLLHSAKKIRLGAKDCFLYTDVGFWFLPAIIENITGEKYAKALQKRIFEPLGAERLMFNPLGKVPQRQIVPTENEKFFYGGLLHGRVHDPVAALMQGEGAHAGLFGNANDIAKVMQMYLNGGRYGGVRFFPEETAKKFTSCLYCDEGIHRGIGFDKPKLDSIKHTAEGVSGKSFGHLGFTGNYVWADPEHEIIYIFLSNRVYPTQKNNKLSDFRTRLKIQRVIYKWAEKRKAEKEKFIG